MYYIVYSLLWLVSLLPLRILYLISDVIYGLVFYIFKYRRDVVFSNLEHAFPEKTKEEIMVIAKKYYRNLTDTFVETVKLFSVSKNFINKHCRADFSLINRLEEKGKAFQIHPAHNFNWEFSTLHFPLHFKLPLLIVYMPLSNKIFDRVFRTNRSRFGSIMLPATDMRRSFMSWRNKPHVLALVGDQNPGHPGNAYWFNFFNRPAPFLKGPERAAKEKSCAVFFVFIKKIKRGYYEAEFVLATEDTSALPAGQLTKMYVDALSERMKAQPENWLWSHRRWKWEWKPEYGEIIK
jgi:KDO2-lipid IV(A) lauroyltransferase